MQDCYEMFASSLLQELRLKLDSITWQESKRSKTQKFAILTRELKKEFCCPEPVKCKRLWHVEKIFGKAITLACDRTNQRANRILKKSKSEKYKKQWKPMKEGPRF